MEITEVEQIRNKFKELANPVYAGQSKSYLKSPFEFYGLRVPEIRKIAKRLHEEHSLKEFYNIFNKLWKSGYHEEMSLALYTLQLYEKDFDLKTWKFLKPKLNNIKSWDQIDAISSFIIGKILLKYPELEKELLKLSKSRDFWLRRIAIVSTLPRIRQEDIRLTMNFAEKYVKDKEPYIQKATGWMLREAGKQKPEIVRRFVLKNMYMPPITFSYATERELKGLRKLRKLKKLKN